MCVRAREKKLTTTAHKYAEADYKNSDVDYKNSNGQKKNSDGQNFPNQHQNSAAANSCLCCLGCRLTYSHVV